MVMVDYGKLAILQQTTQHIKGQIRLLPKQGKLEVILSSEVQEAADVIPELLDNLAAQLATQLQSFMKIQGEIVEVG